MFDDFVVECNLPMPENPQGYSGTKFFQTKDLDCALDLYKIKSDGTVWIKKTKGEWIGGNPKAKSFSERFGHFKLEKEWEEFYNHTFEVDLCGYVISEDGPYDYWIDYRISFVDGIVNKINLKKFEARDNSSRKRINKETMRKLQQWSEYQKTFRYKYFYKYYDRFINFSFKRLASVIDFVKDKTFKLERKLRLSTTPRLKP